MLRIMYWLIFSYLQLVSSTFVEYNLMLEIKYRAIVKQRKSNFEQFVKRQQDREREEEINKF